MKATVRARTGTRGQPVVALVLIMTSWVAARAMLLESEAEAGSPVVLAQGQKSAPKIAASARPMSQSSQAVGTAPAWVPPPEPEVLPPLSPVNLAPSAPPISTRILSAPLVAPSMAAGSLSLWMAAVAKVPLPSFGDQAAPAPLAAPFPVRSHEVTAQARRWSADGWVMLRRGGNVSLAPGPAGSTYGASQAGAVLRYRLSPTSAHRPAAYVRTTTALNGSREREAAVGLSVRPVSGLPVTLAAEARLTDDGIRMQVRPAIAAITELPPFNLPLGIRGEAYLQAGYVGGKAGTAFADGQLRTDHRVISVGRAELRAGGGAWGGIQKGASRLDVGPTATVGLPVTGDVSARLGFDWRFRIAGNAAPASGPAITLSAGF